MAGGRDHKYHPAGVITMSEGSIMSAVKLLTGTQKNSVEAFVTNSLACKKRVLDLLNAISNLQKGDLQAVLGLDWFDFSQEELERFAKNEDDRRLFQSSTGGEAAAVLEERLLTIYSLVEHLLPVSAKLNPGEKDLGDVEFDYSEKP
jgi:hypothetical protein